MDEIKRELRDWWLENWDEAMFLAFFETSNYQESGSRIEMKNFSDKTVFKMLFFPVEKLLTGITILKNEEDEFENRDKSIVIAIPDYSDNQDTKIGIKKHRFSDDISFIDAK